MHCHTMQPGEHLSAAVAMTTVDQSAPTAYNCSLEINNALGVTDEHMYMSVDDLLFGTCIYTR